MCFRGLLKSREMTQVAWLWFSFMGEWTGILAL